MGDFLFLFYDSIFGFFLVGIFVLMYKKREKGELGIGIQMRFQGMFCKERLSLYTYSS